MARFYRRAMAKYEVYVASRKRDLLRDVSGRVLELGPGIGANFAYLDSDTVEWLGIEPNVFMHRQLRETAKRFGFEIQLRGITAEQIEALPESVDVVLCTLVLCSLEDPETALAEAHRVLKPGGRFVFVEHVAAPDSSRLRRRQQWIRPFWRYLADGCCPDRETEAVIRRTGFSSVEVDAFTVPSSVIPSVVSPQISGIAIK